MTLPSSSSKKILILHAAAGAGHRKAAEAVYNGLRSRGGCEPVIADALDHTNSFFKTSYTQGYEFMISKVPKLWGIFFELTDHASIQPLFQGARRIYNGLNACALVKFIKETDPDIVVTAHFLSTEVCGWMRRTGQLRARVVTIVTDYDVHRIWLTRGIDTYLVASDYTKKKLASLGVPDERIVVTGIPVDEKFIQKRDKKAILRKMGLKEDVFTVLLSMSSFGFGPIEELTAMLSDIQLIIICGNNKALYERMAKSASPGHKVCKFVDNMEELMVAADLMITKPGGLSITEALANRLPLIFFSAIPGQEAGNVRVLAEHGIGLSDKELPEIASEIRAFAADPQKLQAAREATKALARPNSVSEIIKNLL